MSEFPKTLSTKCPTCGRKVNVPFLKYTEQFTRTCRGCKRRWRLTVNPTELFEGKAYAHIVHFNTPKD